MAEPISLAEAKLHCRVDTDVDDALIAGLITAAREWVETYTSHVLVARAIVETVDRFGSYISLSHRPVTAISGIEYIDSAGEAQDFPDFTVNLARAPVRLYPVSTWPTLGVNGHATVTYAAGYMEGDAPQALVQAMHLLISHWYRNRGAASAVTDEIAMGVTALCDRYRPVL